VKSASESLTTEQQELLDSGLRMLAHMIVETHLHRTAPIKVSDEDVTREKSAQEKVERAKAESRDKNQLESNHE
jgi:hypothetical protein